MSVTDLTEKKQRNLKPFKPGQSGNPNGRPKGARNRLSETFLKMLEVDWAEHGAEALAKAREKDPVSYVRVVASLLSKDVSLAVDGSLAEVLAAVDGKTRGLPSDTQEPL